MKTQIIDYIDRKSEGDYVFSKQTEPRSLDEFDLNIINLSNSRLWTNHDHNSGFNSVDSINDLKSINQMVKNSRTSKIIYVLPQDILFSYKEMYNSQLKQIRLRDILDSTCKKILPAILPGPIPSILYEPTRTKIGEAEIPAAFYFNTSSDILTFSVASNKPTTIAQNDRVYITSLDITISLDSVRNYINNVIFPDCREEKPSWIEQVYFFDDTIQIQTIMNNQKAISDAEVQIALAKQHLQKNDRYKSILYTNSEELVRVVFDILEQLLEYDLSGFEDFKREDFQIKKESYTLIGEIKGITSNVKSENVTQLETHYQSYCDELDEAGLEENVFQVLIINPLRNRPISERDPINEKQIKLAKRNGSLIVETKTLLKLYEMFLQKQISSKDCERLFIQKTGLLTESDLLPQPQEDISGFMI